MLLFLLYTNFYAEEFGYTYMMCFTLLQVVALAATITWCHAEFRVVDLTHPFGPDAIYWPGSPEFNFTILTREQKPAHWYESNYFGTAEHGGTHLDAPAHFAKGRWKGQQIPIERLMGPGVVINVKDKVKADPDYRVKVEDLTLWEENYGRIPTGAIVVMNSGWDVRYPNKTLTFGSETPSDPETFHFPGFHEDTVDWLLKNRVTHGLGVDTPSTDYGQSKTFPVHVILAKADLIGLENIANLDMIPESGAMIYAAAIKLVDSSGGPARVFATFNEDTDQISAAHRRNNHSITWAAILALIVYIFR